MCRLPLMSAQCQKRTMWRARIHNQPFFWLQRVQNNSRSPRVADRALAGVACHSARNFAVEIAGYLKSLYPRSS